MNLTIPYGWSEIDSDAKEAMIERVKEEMIEAYKTEGEVLLKKEWYDPKPKTWQEAYCRTYAIEWQMWSDYEKNVPDAEVPSQSDWEYYLTQGLEKKAENALYDAFKYMVAEVEL